MQVINETWKSLSPTKRDILVALSHNHPERMNNTELAEALGRSDGRVSTNRGELEALDLISCERDGRQIHVELTAEGHELVGELIGTAIHLHNPDDESL